MEIPLLSVRCENVGEGLDNYCSYWPRDFPAASVVICRDIPALTFQHEGM